MSETKKVEPNQVENDDFPAIEPCAESVSGTELANEQNLKVLTSNEAREYGHIGGIVSGKVRRERKCLREIALNIACAPIKDPAEEIAIREKYKAAGVSYIEPKQAYSYGIVNPSVMESIVYKIASNAVNGNIQAAKLFMEMMGENPAQRRFIENGILTKQEVSVKYKASKQEFEPR